MVGIAVVVAHEDNGIAGPFVHPSIPCRAAGRSRRPRPNDPIHRYVRGTQDDTRQTSKQANIQTVVVAVAHCTLQASKDESNIFIWTENP